MPPKVRSRVRVVSVVIQASDSPGGTDRLLKCLNATGTVVRFDPRWTLPYHVELDDGRFVSFAEDNLEVLEP